MIKKVLLLVIFAIVMNGCNEERVSSTPTTETTTISVDTLNKDTSYMWLDTTKGEDLTKGKDTLIIYTYHTNGMSALLRIPNLAYKNYRTLIIYQDSKGIPRAIMRRLDSWWCIDRRYLDRLIQISGKNTYETYYQVIFDASYDRFHIAKNPIACEDMTY